MKKIWILLILLLLFGSVCISCDGKEQSNTNHEYLIDIIVKNDENLPIEYLTLSSIVNEQIIKITDAHQVSKQNYIHFAVSYTGEKFILSGKAKDMQIVEFYFDLKDARNTQTPQKLELYAHKKGNSIIITHVHK